ncbi:MAG: HAD-IA family hydrolase [Dongiaceae bacterium]
MSEAAGQTGPAFRLVVFDCDGTLVDSQHSIVAAMNIAFEDAGLDEPDAAAVRHVVGLALEEAIARLLPRAIPEQHRQVAAAYRRAFHILRQRPDYQELLFPGIREVIEGLERAGSLLGVATGKSRRGLIATLERHGLRDKFVTLQTVDDNPGKPAPDMLLRAMRETGAEPAQTAMIGDTIYDLEMARRAGTAAIAATWGYHDVAELGPHADAVAESPAALLSVIEILSGRFSCVSEQS